MRSPFLFNANEKHLDSNDLEALFHLYDLDHNQMVSFDEYLVSVVVLMDGTLDEKILRILSRGFLCVDS